jgi:hypothetical protein
MINIKSISCKISLILALSFTLNIIKAEEPKITISYPLSGMHTRSETILIEGKLTGFTAAKVLLILDESTVLTKYVDCVDGIFQLEVKLGSGRTTISAQAKIDGKPMVETGFYIFRDCTVTNIIGQSEVYVNSDKRELDALIKLENNRSLVPVRQIAGYFGATVGWDAKNRQCIVTIGRRQSTIKLGSDTAVIAGQKIESKPPAKIIDGTLYVSSRLFSKTIGGGVAWDAYTRTISIAVP